MRGFFAAFFVVLALLTSPGVLTPHPVSAAAQQTAGNPDVKVWVNTNSGIYHCPGTRWYGNTKSGKYMSQKDAQASGYRPANGKVCR
ncbi:MAG: hypothetical protein HYX72_04110 [Acidobacteria bacterium]|nr:hypothetical protein [Acidobacteriota bacterium]